MAPVLAPLSDEEFDRMTAYCQASDNPASNLRRAQLLGLKSEGVRVAPGAIIRLHGMGSIAAGCFIGLYTYLNGEVILEENVIIGPHVSLTSNTHTFEPATRAFTGSAHSPIRIGRGTWLCAGVSVTAGVNIGPGNLICAHAVVTKETPPFAIMAGVPARCVGRIDPATGDYHWTRSTAL